MARVLRVDPSAVNGDAIEEAAAVIRGGGIVAFPTETVYGLGADAFNLAAVMRIFEAKGRPPDNPLIVHVTGLEQAAEVASEIPEEARALAERFWPGPLTLVLRASGSLPREVTGGLPTVAVRAPAHPVALKLIEASGRPIAAPSANASGRPSPTRAEHVVEDLGGRVDLILDAGETLYGVESTIVDLTRDPPLLLRPGALPLEELSRALGKDVALPGFARGLADAPRALAPGTKYRHYAPRKPLMVVESSDYGDLKSYAGRLIELARKAESEGKRALILASSETAAYYRGLGLRCVELGSRANQFEVARNLFSALRALDGLDVDLAIAEGFEERGLGLAVMDRLRKASGHNVVIV